MSEMTPREIVQELLRKEGEFKQNALRFHGI